MDESPLAILSTIIATLTIIMFLLSRRHRRNSKKSSQTENFLEDLEEKLEKFKPLPLADQNYSNNDSEAKNQKANTANAARGNSLPLPATEGVINVAQKDYLSLGKSSKVRESAAGAIETYAVGACGPPSFFGDSEVHAVLHAELKALYKTEHSFLYSYGTLTLGSMIATYVTPDDTVAYQRTACVEIKRSLRWLKCRRLQFEDLDHLQTIIPQSRPFSGRLFIVCEAIGENTGVIADVPLLASIAKKEKAWLVLDESYSFGVLGANGTGVFDYYGIHIDDTADVVGGSLEHTFGVMGGYSAGRMSTLVVQQLTSKSYVYSASLPAFAVVALRSCLEHRAQRHLKLGQFSRKLQAFLGRPEMKVLNCISSGDSPRKVLAVEGERRERLLDFCSGREVYLGEDSSCGVVINLNYDLCVDENKYERLLKVLEECSGLLASIS